MALKIFTAPAASPVSLQMMKNHLRVDHSHDDQLIQEMIDDATSFVDGPDGFLQRALITQTWDLYWDEWPCDDDIAIPLPPLQTVDLFQYRDSDGNWIPLVENTDYVVDAVSTPGWLVVSESGWPSSIWNGVNVVHVRFTAGYGASSDRVPASIRGAIRLLVGNAYRMRESIHETSIQNDKRVHDALSLYRIMTV